MVVVVLSGCASDSVTIKYYTLGGQESSTQMVADDQNNVQRPLILIEPIAMVDFLRQPGLVIQKTEHQIQISNIHRWSEELARATSRIIRKQLEMALPKYRFENQGRQWKAKPKYRLNIELEQFHIINHHKQVVTSGQIWLFDDDRKLILKKVFSFEEPLNKNGYEHAVSKLELILNKLSQQITESVTALP